ncbi:hypothetical protein DRO61_04135 [Candidatus Bathyarchaeota archaeon]|nr:MAG: hypothetical protein DRO61_04135 [Candidatus Bathyarchaeota archaeon]
MALILRDSIAKNLFRFGKKVEEEIKQGNKLDIVELNKLLIPTLETIESKAVSFATKEVEENIAKTYDNERKRKRERICETRRAILSEQAILKTPMKRMRIERTLASNISVLEDSTTYSPTNNIDCLNDDEVLKYDTDDDSWDRYLPEVWTAGEGECTLCGGDLKDLLEYLDDNANTVEDMVSILRSVKKKDILTYGYFLDGMVKLCELLILKKDDTNTETPSPIDSGGDSGESTEPLWDDLDMPIPILVNDNFEDIIEEIIDDWDDDPVGETRESSENA